MKFDWIMAAALAALTGWGVAVQVRLAGSVPELSGLAPLMLGTFLGLAAIFVCAQGRAGRFLAGKGPWIAWGVAVALLVALLLMGRRYRGGLYLPGRINPSELVKVCLVAFAAGILGRGERRTFADGRAFGVFVAGTGTILLLVAAAGDFGLVAQLAVTLAVLLWAVSWGWGLLALGTVAAGAFLVCQFPLGHLATRVNVWRDPLQDPTGTGWQTLQGLTALVTGGWRGVGFGQGNLDSLPIASSDFVYAAVGEDLGWWGCAFLLVLWGAVCVRGLWAALGREEAKDRGGALLAVGVTASLAIQVLLNVGGVINAVPMTGITLPLISHGGSSLVVTLLLGGILLGLSRRADTAGMPSGRGMRPARPSRQTRKRTIDGRRRSPPGNGVRGTDLSVSP